QKPAAPPNKARVRRKRFRVARGSMQVLRDLRTLRLVERRPLGRRALNGGLKPAAPLDDANRL
ncbi:MAG TPA: hypothetical protein VF911_10920, partial [Thermoanaerobaculia bacterium]